MQEGEEREVRGGGTVSKETYAIAGAADDRRQTTHEAAGRREWQLVVQTHSAPDPSVGSTPNNQFDIHGYSVIETDS